jgi:hypothetical protein
MPKRKKQSQPAFTQASPGGGGHNRRPHSTATAAPARILKIQVVRWL